MKEFLGFVRKFGCSTRYWVLLLCLGSAATVARAALYEPNPANFGSVQANTSDCDDCADGPIAFGAGQTLTFFGIPYSGLFVGSNGYVTLGGAASSFSPTPLNTQTVAPMIAGLYTDLDSQSNAASQVFVNTATPGQIIVTWFAMGHFYQNYAAPSTFQLVIRSDQFAVPAGEGRIGFFYDSVGDPYTVAAGFGDGLAAVNPGETAFYYGAGTGVNNNAPRWFNLDGGVPSAASAGPAAVPTLAEWGLLLLAAAIIGLTWHQTRYRIRI